MKQIVIVVGNLGADPEMRHFPDGTAVTNFSVASNHKWTGSDGEKHEDVTWFRIRTTGRRAEVCKEYLRKGSQVLVEGRLVSDANGNPPTFQRNDGTIGTSFEIRAQSVDFLGGRQDDGGLPSRPQGEEDEIPF
jgi:single-strand DNA-binding protein